MAGLHISVSQIKTYLRCPRQYELHYVKGTPPAFVPIPLAFGTCIHSALSYFYGIIKETGRLPKFDEVTAIFDDSWANVGSGTIPLQAEDDDKEIDHQEKAKAMLQVFYDGVAARPIPEVKAVEQGFAVDLHDPNTGEVLEEKLIGTFDLLLLEAGQYVVAEHKSSARKYSNDQLTNDFQLVAYKMAARQLGWGEAKLRFNIITKTKVPTLQVVDVQRSKQDEDDFRRIAVGVLRAVDAQAFFPVRGWQCKGCQYGYACRSVT